MNKSRPIQLVFRVNEKEYQQIKEKIAASGKSQQEYILSCALDKEILNMDALHEITVELKRVGNNLNQIARTLNEKKFCSYGLIVENQKELKKIWQLLRRYLQEPK